MPPEGVGDDEIDERLTKSWSDWLLTFSTVLAFLGVVRWQERSIFPFGFIHARSSHARWKTNQGRPIKVRSWGDDREDGRDGGVNRGIGWADDQGD
jgi:hypothetical protein